MSKFKVGDRVEKVNGVKFSNRQKVATISKVEKANVWFTETGTFLSSDDVRLVKEPPIRTVTRKEIVPGVYGMVRVAKAGIGISISLDPFYTPSELREAAHILNQIAEALEDGVV